MRSQSAPNARTLASTVKPEIRVYLVDRGDTSQSGRFVSGGRGVSARLGVLRCERPGEASRRATWRYTTRAESASDEQRRDAHARRNREAHRSDALARPTVRQSDDGSRASCEASRTPSSPGRTRTGSVTIPTTCCTSIEARARSLLASRWPVVVFASVPRRRRVVPRESASHAASSIADNRAQRRRTE